MLILLLVILLLGTALELASVRAGTDSIEASVSITPDRTEPGQPVCACTEVRNLSRLPVSFLEVQTAFPLCTELAAESTEAPHAKRVFQVFRLFGRRKRTQTVSFSTEKRGVHTVCIEQLRRGDFLGVTEKTAAVAVRKTVLVYPRLLQSGVLRQALEDWCGEMQAAQSLLRDPILTLGVRDYTGTEPMHDISWMRTAARGELTVREFDHTRSMRCAVVFCNEPGTPEQLDTACSAARTVCQTLTENGAALEFYTNAVLYGCKDQPVRHCRRMQDVPELLARTGERETCPPELLVRELPPQQAVVLLTPVRTRAAEDAAAYLRRHGAGVLLLSAQEVGA